LILVLVPLVLSVLVIGTTYALILNTDALRFQENAERRTADNACRTLLALADSGMCFEKIFLEHKKEFKARLKDDITEYRALREDSKQMQQLPAFRGYADEMDSIMNEMPNRFQEIIGAFKRGDIQAALSGLQTFRQWTNTRVYKLSHSASGQSDKLIGDLEKAQAKQRHDFEAEKITLIVGVIASILCGLLLSRLFMTGIAQRLRVVMDNTIRLTRNQPLNPTLTGNDEIATLDRGFHSMAAALREAMAKEKALFESASDLICIFDEDYKITAVNPAFTRLLDYPQEDIIGRNLLHLIVPEDKKRTADALNSTTSGAAAIVFESRIENKEMQPVDMLWSVFRSRIDRALYAVAHDITERKRIERAKEEFLAMVSHDLRSPLASMYGTFKLLSASAFGPLEGAIQDKLSVLIANCNRLLGLVNDLLDMEKLEAGQLELTVERIKVPELLAKAADEVAPLSHEKSIRFDIDCTAREFSLDPDRTMQVLVNLFSNAIKYSPDGSTIKVTAVADHKQITFRIADRGRGIPADQRAQIFERFKQVKSSDAKVGTGLGLPICKLIVDQHGGQIGVEPNGDGGEDAGSIFWFTLSSSPKLIQDAVIKTDAQSIGAVTMPMPIRVDASQLRGTLKNQAPTKQLDRYSFTNWPLLWKGAGLIVIPVIFELALAGLLFPSLIAAFEEQQQELHYLTYASLCDDMMVKISGVAVSMSLNPWDAKWPAFSEYAVGVKRDDQKLFDITKDDPDAHALVLKVHESFLPFDEFTGRAFSVVQRFGNTQAVINGPAFDHRDELYNAAEDALPRCKQAMTIFTDRGNESPEKLKRVRREQAMILFGGLAVSLAISAFSALMFGLGIARRLKVTEDNVHRLERDEQLNPPLPGSDELSSLDHYFHNMARALYEARKKEKDVFDNSQDIMSAWSDGGRILRANPAIKSTLGYTPSEVVGKSIVDMVAQEHKEAAQQAIERCGENMPQTELETTVVREDGSQCEVLWSLSWSAQEQAIIAIGHDISERKRLEALKKEFLAMVSHDMRTPLSGISMMTEMMIQGTLGQLPEKAAQQLQTVSRSCERLLVLINDLLDMEKLEAGKMQLDVHQVDVFELLGRIADTLANTAMQKRIDVLINAPQGLEIEADDDRLLQVGVNLLSNAIKFSPVGSSIHLSARSKGDFIEVAVSDSGRGIPESHLQSIFDRYKQVQAADGKRSTGTGLGLPIAKQIVEQHGGEIGVISRIEQGTTFWFRLPVLQDKGRDSDKPAELPPGALR